MTYFFVSPSPHLNSVPDSCILYLIMTNIDVLYFNFQNDHDKILALIEEARRNKHTQADLPAQSVMQNV
jgi:hypothetical protein